MKRNDSSSRRRLTSTGRRTFLGALCGTAAAVPFLRSFPVGAFEGSSLPKVLFVGYPNGPLVGPSGGDGVDGWRPDNVAGFDTALPANEGGFPDIFKPLHPFRDHLVFLDNISFIDGSNSHRQTSAMLTGRRRYYEDDIKDYTSSGISVDHYLANHFRNDPERSTGVLNTGFRMDSTFAPGENYWSYTGARQRVESIQNPVNTYMRVFGEGLDTSQAERLLAKRRSILDVVSKDLGRMMQRVPSEDRPRLEQHLDGIRGIEQNLTAVVCAEGNPIDNYDFRAHTNAPRVMRDHTSVITQAMACGHSRIATLQFGSFGGNPRPNWPELGIAHGDHTVHAICHAFAGIDGAASDGLTPQQGKQLGVAKEVAYAKMYANVLTQLQNTPDAGGGTLLDNTLVIFARPMGRNHASGRLLWIAAGGTGRGVAGGRWLNFEPDTTYYNDVLTAVCAFMEHPVDTFGEAQFCTTPVPLEG